MLADEATIERLSNDEDLFEAVEEYGDESTTIAYDIDKLWDGLHFLLTGVSAQETIENNPLSEAIVGTKIFDCEDFIAYTYPNHIKDIVDALNKADIEVLIESMDLSKFRKTLNAFSKYEESVISTPASFMTSNGYLLLPAFK